MLTKVLILFFSVLFLQSCGGNYSEEEKDYIEEIKASRAEKDSTMMRDPYSPFNQDEKAEFSDLKYFDVDPSFLFESKLRRYERMDTISVFGTKGEKRKAVRFGYLTINRNNKNYKVNVYKNFSKNGDVYYSIWFTDETTGEETYGVGRYLDFELSPDSGYVYTIDFNLAYNPYCAYSSRYSCAVPTKEDHLNLAIEAGEKSFH